MSELTSKVKVQLDQLNGSLDQVAKASRGLVIKVSQASSKRFEDLVKTGEAQEGKSLAEQMRETFDGQFVDVKSSINQLRFAMLGLFTKTTANSSQLFNELVSIGSTKNTPAKKAKASPNRTTKTSVAA